MNELTPYVIRPNNINELMQLSKMIAASNFCPNSMRGKEGDVAICIQFGAELGLSPMQSIQNIAVIQGKPCVWGDAALAVVISSPNYEWHKEWQEGSASEGTLTCYCTVKRKGSPEYTKSFSMADAKKAGLWSKAGVWQQYPDRMLQMRARAFAIRDQFADALRGISVREEVEDYNEKPQRQTLNSVNSENTVNSIDIIHSDVPYSIEQAINDIRNCKSEDELKSVFEKRRMFEKGSDELNAFIKAKDEKKLELQKNVVEAEFESLETGEVKDE